MTLSRQLFAGITIAFLALLVGMEAIYVSSARTSLEQQLDAHANETATALALSMGARLTALDASSANIMVNPIFDRGHFASIEVFTPNGERVFARTLERSETDVPRWFTALVPLMGPTGEALISSGWRQLGKVVVRVHPGYAYRQLYDTALATLAWLAVLFALALAAVRHHLTGILKPLRQIEAAAIAISNRDFVSIDIEPRTRELQRVTHAINSLSSKIRDTIVQESRRAEQLRKQAFEDSLTGQLNRRGFEQAVRSSIDEWTEIHSGSLALFALSGLEEINRVFGMSRGDAIVRELGVALAARKDKSAPIVGRWQGPTLAAFEPNATPESSIAWATALSKAFVEDLRKQGMPSGVTVSSGLVFFSGATDFTQLAQAAENALALAARQGAGAVVASSTDTLDTGLDLKKEIEDTIRNNRVTLLGQKVISIADASTLQLEILASLTGNDGKTIAAAAFIPVANQHGLLAALDTKVMQQTLAAIENLASLPPVVSMNVAMQSVADSGFRSALREALAHHPRAAKRLVFEITGYTASRAPKLTLEFSAEIRALGARVALDNFDIDRTSIAMVHELLPVYIKLAVGFTSQIRAREELRFIVEAVVRMLRPLEIPLIAQGVEDASGVALLGELGLSAYQGFAGGRPEPLIV